MSEAADSAGPADPQRPTVERLSWGAYDHQTGIYRLTSSHGFFAHTMVVTADVLRLAARGIEVAGIRIGGGYSLYRDAPGQDVYGEFYEGAPEVLVTESVKSENDLAGFIRFEYFSRIPFSELPFAPAAQVLKKFFAFRGEILAKADEMARRMAFDPAETICIYYRGTDKSAEVVLAGVDQYMDVCDRLLERFPGKRVLLQSDDLRVMQLMQAYYGACALIVPGVPASAKGRPSHRGRERSGMAGLRAFVTAWLLMLRCPHIVCTGSNVSMALALYRGSQRNLVVFDHAGAMLDYT